jgi:hypothetical protein
VELVDFKLKNTPGNRQRDSIQRRALGWTRWKMRNCGVKCRRLLPSAQTGLFQSQRNTSAFEKKQAGKWFAR